MTDNRQGDKRSYPPEKQEGAKIDWVKEEGDFFIDLPNRESALHLSFGNTFCPCHQHRQQCLRGQVDSSSTSKVLDSKTQVPS